MKYFLYIFYRYYKRGSYESLPYISALILFVLSTGFYLLSVYLFNFPETELPDKNTFVIWALSTWSFACFLVWCFISEKDLQNPEFEKRYDSSHGLLALLFVIFGFLLLITAIFYTGVFKENARKEFVKSQQRRMQPIIDKYRLEHPDASDAEIIVADDSIIGVNPIP